MSNSAVDRFSISLLQWLERIIWERYGNNFNINKKNNTLEITMKGSNLCIIFDQLQGVFHESRSDFPCFFWDASAEGFDYPIDKIIPMPSEVELNVPVFEKNSHGYVVHYDILGLVSWMLNRVEEIARSDLDQYQRFPATSSHAYENNYLERPIVDEWLHILGQVILRVWPELTLKKHQYELKLSHDVDTPSLYAFKSWGTIFKMMAGDLIKRRSFNNFFKAPYIKLFTRSKLSSFDPFNTFDWIMNLSENNNVKSTFYFLCGKTDPVKDSDYELDFKSIRNLMRNINDRGHFIGLHPSFNTYQSLQSIKSELELLKKVCSEEDIKQKIFGGRMHYLRWKSPDTLNILSEVGLSHDSTLGYADMPGFRCGSCYEFPAFNFREQVPLNIRVRPLIVMECSIIEDIYLGLGCGDLAIKRINAIKESCIAVNGCFELLWHNSSLVSPDQRNMYSEIVKH